MDRYDQLPETAARRVRAPLRWTWAGLWAERGARAFWPLATIIVLFAAWVLSGLSLYTSGAFNLGVAIVAAISAVVALVFGIARFNKPSRADALDRLDATLPGAPLATLSDEQAIGAADPASQAVWEAHLTRMARRLDAARAQGPRANLAPRDPFALRLIALTALAVAVLFGARAAGPGLGAALPGGGEALAQSSWEGWVEPPAYTGKPTLYLGDQPPGTVSVPTGSRVTLRLYGEVDEIEITEGWSDTAPDAAPMPTRYFVIDSDGPLTINDTTWQFAALADLPPEIDITGEMTRDLAGEMRQGFTARDDYGVTMGQARFTLNLPAVNRTYGLQAEPEARPPLDVDLPMPFRGSREEIDEVLVDNFAEHPWATLPVTVTFSALDAAGQEGISEPVTLTLPGRRFLNPLAQAIIEMRRDVLWSMDNAQASARILRAVSNRPEGIFPKPEQADMLRASLGPLEEDDLNPSVRDEVAQALWDLAVEIEEGALNDALEALRRAQERLNEAMEQGATPEELSELMDELRQAMRDYMEQLAEQAEQNGEQQQQAQNGETMEMNQQDLQEMMDRIEELMREGRMEEAQEMLRALQQMMENMQVTQGQQGQGQGEQAMQGLQDTLRDQRDLSDDTFQQQQGQGQQGQQNGQQQGQNEGQQQGGQGQNGEEGQSESLAQRQQRLENELGRQRDNLPGAGTEEGEAARDALDRARRAMEDAADALEQGDTSGALDRQAEAMEEMREGMRNLEEAMRNEAEDSQEQQAGGQGEGRGGPDGRDQRDPLGREAGERGALSSDSPLADGEDVYRRAEELMEELRRRSGETDRPDVERDYLERLLDLF